MALENMIKCHSQPLRQKNCKNLRCLQYEI